MNGIPSPTDFQPESYEGKPRWLPKPEKHLLCSFVDPLYDRVEAMSREERQLLIRACLQVSPINCGWDEYAIAKLLFHKALYDETIAETEHSASAIEAPSGVETAQTGSTEGESAARSEAKGDAQ